MIRAIVSSPPSFSRMCRRRPPVTKALLKSSLDVTTLVKMALLCLL